MHCLFDARVTYLYHLQVMSAKLPELIDPVLLAERRSVLSGAIKIATLERLSDLVAESNGDVHTELIFSKVGKRVLVSGTIKTTLQIICQSCLQAMPWPLDLAFKLGVVSSSQEAEQLEIDCEPLQYNGEKISLSAIFVPINCAA